MTANAKAKLRPAVVAELEAFFDRSESTFGLSSNFGPLIAMAMSGGAGGRHPASIDAGMVGRIERGRPEHPKHGERGQVGVQRAVFAALREIGDPHRTVLWAAHAHHVAPPEVKNALGLVARVALMTKVVAEGYKATKRTGELLEAWLVRAAKRPDDIGAIRKQAETLLEAAHVAYAAAREPKGEDKGIGAFRKQTRGPRAPVVRRSVATAFDPSGWRP